jgi:DNA-binding NarL/FixJ family response regulator
MLARSSGTYDTGQAERGEVLRSLDALEGSLTRLGQQLAHVDGELRAIRASYRRLCEVSRLPELPLPPLRRLEALSARERRVALLAAGGHSNLEIASELCVSLETVKSQMRSVLRKLELPSRWQLDRLWSAAGSSLAE